MEWTFNEDIPWLYPPTSGGNVPGTLELIANAGDSFTIGTYYDTAYIEADGATNTHKPVAFKLQVWKLAGDYNWDGIIDLSDIIYIVEYFFDGGPAPLPENRVADLNCDFHTDISDLIYLVDYMFNNGPIPCGNPY